MVWARTNGTIASMVVPILIGDQVEGLLIVTNHSPRPFTDADEAILARLADHSHRGRPLSPLATAHHLRIDLASVTIFQGRVCMCRIGLLLQFTGVRPMR